MQLEIKLPHEDDEFINNLTNFDLEYDDDRTSLKIIVSDQNQEENISKIISWFIVKVYERNMVSKYAKQLNTLKEITPSIEYLTLTLLNDDVREKKEQVLGREVSEIVKCGKFDITGFVNFRCRKYRNLIKETVLDSYVLIISKIISDI